MNNWHRDTGSKLEKCVFHFTGTLSGREHQTCLKCSHVMLLTMICVLEAEWALLIEHVWLPCFIDSPAKTVCIDGHHSVSTWSNRQGSLRGLLQYIFHLLQDVAATEAAATCGVFPANNGSIWSGRWTVVQTGSFRALLFSHWTAGEF